MNIQQWIRDFEGGALTNRLRPLKADTSPGLDKHHNKIFLGHFARGSA